MGEQTSYPLSWPEGWPRTAPHLRRDSPFQRPMKFAARYHSMDEARREQAFRGYMALPGVGQTSGHNWWEVLGVAVNASPEQVKDAFRVLVAKHHPDKGGEAELFRRVTEAYQQFERIERKAA